jgi:putative nucleotidyltransferase with HDIG domain
MTTLLTIEEYLQAADRLSTAPRILPRLLDVLSDPNSDVSQIIELISFDPGLTSKVLRASNSAFVGLSEPANDVSEAVNLLGINFIYQLAAAACGASTFQSDSDGPANSLWPHAVTTALAAQILAEDLSLEQGPLFTAALLHDIGKAVFAEQWSKHYWSVVEPSRSEPARLLELEEQAFKVNHAELGGRLLAYWKFPPSIAASVWHHHEPLPRMPYEKETACVALADAVAEGITEQPDGSAKLFTLTSGQQGALAVFNLAEKDLERYLERTQENFEFVDAMCQMRF